MSFPLSFHLALFGPTGAYWLDDPSDLSSKDSTRQHSVDDPLLSCNPLLVTWGRGSSRAQSAMRHQMEYLVPAPPAVTVVWVTEDSQTILLYPSGAVWTDEAPNLSSPDPSGADQTDAEHQATDLAVAAVESLRHPASALCCVPGIHLTGGEGTIGCILWSSTVSSSPVRCPARSAGVAGR
jgi:hypothetical protein